LSKSAVSVDFSADGSLQKLFFFERGAIAIRQLPPSTNTQLITGKARQKIFNFFLFLFRRFTRDFGQFQQIRAVHIY
jgi:hypothetical protein